MTQQYKSKKPALPEQWLGPLYRFSSLWPKVNSSKMFVLEAVNVVGHAEFGEQWTNHELDAMRSWEQPLLDYKRFLERQIADAEGREFVETPLKLGDIKSRYLSKSYEDFYREKAEELSELHASLQKPPQSILDEQAEWEINKASLDRLRHVASWIGTRARDKQLEGYYQVDGDRELRALDHVEWNCNSDFTGWLVTAGAKMKHRSSSGSATEMVDARFFLSRESLQKALDAGKIPALQTAPELDRLHLSPYMRLMLHIIAEEGIDPEHQSSVFQLETALKAAAPKFGLEVSESELSGRLLKAMPTLMREKSSRRGGATKKG